MQYNITATCELWDGRKATVSCVCNGSGPDDAHTDLAEVLSALDSNSIVSTEMEPVYNEARNHKIYVPKNYDW